MFGTFLLGAWLTIEAFALLGGSLSAKSGSKTISRLLQLTRSGTPA
jgi:hypothetical protein